MPTFRASKVTGKSHGYGKEPLKTPANAPGCAEYRQYAKTPRSTTQRSRIHVSRTIYQFLYPFKRHCRGAQA
jgi:hypothetical protein